MGLSKDQQKILRLLRKLWRKSPEQRLGQLLENYIFTEGQRGDKTSIRLFYQSDERTLAVLKAQVKDKQK